MNRLKALALSLKIAILVILVLLTISFIERYFHDKIIKSKTDFEISKITTLIPCTNFTMGEWVPLHQYDKRNTQNIEKMLTYENSKTPIISSDNKKVLCSEVWRIDSFGYSDWITILLSITNDKIHMLDIAYHLESPGIAYGLNKNRSDWLNQFEDISLNEEFSYRNQLFDSMTGATITSDAIIEALEEVSNIKIMEIEK